jgi:uncharacterized protein (TIGR02246 family)
VHHCGRAAIAAGQQGISDSIYAGSTDRYEIDRARQVTARCVVAVVSATLVAPHGPLRGTNHARFTLTIVEEVERWLTTAFQNTLFPPVR